MGQTRHLALALDGAAPKTDVKEITQTVPDVFARGDEKIVDAAKEAAAAHVGEKSLYGPAVCFPKRPRFGEHLFIALDIVELHGIVEGQFDLIGVEHVEEDDLVAAVLEFAEGILKAVKETQLRVPLVVRLEGNRAAEGRRALAESGLNVIPAELLQEAAAKAAELARS